MVTWMKWLLALSAAVGCTLAGRSLFHYFQLESYQFPGYFRTLKRNLHRAVRPGAALVVVTAAVLAAFSTPPMNAVLRVIVILLKSAVLIGCGLACRKLFDVKKAKKPLVMTPRMKRLHLIAAVTYTLVAMALMMLGPWMLILVPLLLPVWTALAGLCAWPIEKLITELYFRDAQRKLKGRPDLIKIGITGSYGKTSVKFILGTLLEEKYQVLVTPSSFNTPMGVTRIVREKLQPAHQIFVAEMGARHVGDIKELCRLVHPTLGVLTSVGPQHLDTFHSIDRIKSTKYELMDAIPTDGCCFFPDDGAICRELYDKTSKPRRLCSLNKTADADVWAENITVSPSGSQFVLCAGEERIACETRLLGAHNIQNILLAVTVCRQLGLSMRQIARGIGRLEPVEHRLQLMNTPGGITIIDDAFNSNPRGAEAALDVIAGFPERRIIITPGMVELGAGEDEFNRSFGRKMAKAVDIAILVGVKHTRPIADGLREAGFPEADIHPVASLDEASSLLWQLARKGDVALFENDLPDNYSEQ